MVHSISFQTAFVQACKIVVDSCKSSMLLLHILWDDWPICMISDSNQQLQQEFEYTLLKLDCHSWWISKLQSRREDTLEERYAIKSCFKLGKNTAETYRMLQIAWIEHQFLIAIRDSRKARGLWGMMRGVGGVRKSIQQSWLAKGLGLGYYVEVLREFRKIFRRKKPALFKSSQWHFHQDNVPDHNSILLTDYLTKMGIKLVPQLPYRPDLAPCDFWLFPKPRGCRYETIEGDERGCDEGHWHPNTRGLWWGLLEVVGTVKQAHCNRRKLLWRRLEFHVCIINKSAHTKKVWKLI